MENSVAFLQIIKKQQKKLEIELLYDPVISLLDIYPKEGKTRYSRDTCILTFTTALFTIAKLWKQPRCPTIQMPYYRS
jgi:hypothetical protein